MKLGYISIYIPSEELAGSNNFLFVKNSLANKALKVGAVAVKEPTAKPWGQVVSYVRDLNGALIEICSPIEMVSKAFVYL